MSNGTEISPAEQEVREAAAQLAYAVSKYRRAVKKAYDNDAPTFVARMAADHKWSNDGGDNYFTYVPVTSVQGDAMSMAMDLGAVFPAHMSEDLPAEDR